MSWPYRWFSEWTESDPQIRCDRVLGALAHWDMHVCLRTHEMALDLRRSTAEGKLHGIELVFEYQGVNIVDKHTSWVDIDKMHTYTYSTMADAEYKALAAMVRFCLLDRRFMQYSNRQSANIPVPMMRRGELLEALDRLAGITSQLNTLNTTGKGELTKIPAMPNGRSPVVSITDEP